MNNCNDCPDLTYCSTDLQEDYPSRLYECSCNRVVFRTEAEVKYLLRKHLDNTVFNEIFKYGFVAGGSLVTLFTSPFHDPVLNDIDFFFPTEECFDKALQLFNGYRVKRTDNAVRVSVYPPIHLVCKSFLPLYKTIGEFDLVNSGVAFDGDKFYYVKGWKSCIESRKIVFQNHSPVSDKIQRVYKYYAKGFRIDEVELIKMSIILDATPEENLNVPGYYEVIKMWLEDPLVDFDEYAYSQVYSKSYLHCLVDRLLDWDEYIQRTKDCFQRKYNEYWRINV